MVAEEHELEPWKEKLLRKASLDDSFSDAATPHGSDDDDDENDILVHGSDDGPSSEDRELLNEEDEREKLLTRGRRNPKVLVGKHARRKSIESLMEDGTLSRVAHKVRRSSTVNPSCPAYSPLMVTCD
jgi:hypothetical protein